MKTATCSCNAILGASVLELHASWVQVLEAAGQRALPLNGTIRSRSRSLISALAFRACCGGYGPDFGPAIAAGLTNPHWGWGHFADVRWTGLSLSYGRP